MKNNFIEIKKEKETDPYVLDDLQYKSLEDLIDLLDKDLLPHNE